MGKRYSCSAKPLFFPLMATIPYYITALTISLVYSYITAVLKADTLYTVLTYIRRERLALPT